MEELIEMFHEVDGNSGKSFDIEILEKNNFSIEQWECLLKLSRELELNDNGVRILINEVRSGHVHLPRNK